MLSLEPLHLAGAAGASLLLVLAALQLKRRLSGKSGDRPAGQADRGARREAGDLLSKYRPVAVRVLTGAEREALELVRRALPERVVMAQVPLVRYLRVEDKRVEDDWLRSLSILSADILVCDASSRPLLAIDVHPTNMPARAMERHERMKRVLESVGVEVLVWQDGKLPDLEQARATLRTLLEPPAKAERSPAEASWPSQGARAPARPEKSARRAEPALGDASQFDTSRDSEIPPAYARAASAAKSRRSAAPLERSQISAASMQIPVPDISELLAEGDAIAARHPSMEPVSLTFFDELEPLQQNPSGTPARTH